MTKHIDTRGRSDKMMIGNKYFLNLRKEDRPMGRKKKKKAYKTLKAVLEILSLATGIIAAIKSIIG